MSSSADKPAAADAANIPAVGFILLNEKPNDGFFKKGFDTVTLPKSIDTDTPEGNKAAGKIVDQLKDAKKRGEKMKVDQQNSDWENRKPQITVKKEEG